jgi:hypothetical protein
VVTSEQPPPVDPDAAEPTRERVVVRRAPKIWGFLGVGVIVGVLATLVLTLAFRPEGGAATVTEDGTEFGLSQVFGFLLVCLIPLGGALGALVAIILDRVLARRAVEVDVERIDVAASSADEQDAVPPVGPRAPDSAEPGHSHATAAHPTTPNEDPTRP